MELKFYKCVDCDNVIYELSDKTRNIVCDGKEYKLLVAGVVDAAKEKHIPDVKVVGDVLEITIGEVVHPMTTEHHIQSITLQAGNNVYHTQLDPLGEPKTKFNLNGYKGKVSVYEYCNLHGLWKKELEI